jgi:hypothetical protein
VKSLNKILLLLTAALLLNSGAFADESGAGRIALLSDDMPVVEFHRNSSGSFRSELNSDLLLGMSLGISPAGVANAIDFASGNRRWHPVFNLLAAATQQSNLLLPEHNSHLSRRSIWYLAFGRRFSASNDVSFSIQDDFSRNFSLQSKAGFLVPIGKSTTIGATITLDYQVTNNPRAKRRSRDNSASTGAYLGLKIVF